MAFPLATGQSDPRTILAQSLLQGGLGRTPQNVGQGIDSVGKAIVGALLAKQGIAAQQESAAAGREALLSAFDQPGMAGGDPAQRMMIANLLTDPNVMSQPGAQPIVEMLLQGLQGPDDVLSPEAFEQQQTLRAAGRASTNVNVGSPNVSLTTGTQTDVQKRQINAQGTLARLDDIAGQFRPEFLEVPTRIGMAWNSFKDKLGSVRDIFGIEGLTPAQKQELAEYTTFTTRTLNNLNITLNELSGAAVNEQEFARIKGALPNADDSPTEFQAKLTNAVRDQRRAIARYSYAQNQGLNPLESGIALDGIDALVQQTGESLYRELVDQGIPEDQAAAAVRTELQQLFGLGG